MTILEEAAIFFERVPSLRTKFATLQEVGLGYIQVGWQSAVTLSGGEAQRIKLARELKQTRYRKNDLYFGRTYYRAFPF